MHGTSDISNTDAEYDAAGLLGHRWGQGIPIGSSAETGGDTILRYIGENHLCCLAMPGSGKFTDEQSRIILECAATRSQFIIDASGGQIASALIRELRKHARVKVFYAFGDELPEGLPELLGPSASHNEMDLLNPESSGYGVQCDAVAEIVHPDLTGSDSGDTGFFTPSAREVSSGVIMHIKEFGRPEEQNLATVANIIRQRKIFRFARAVMKNPNARKYAKERLAPFAEVGAEFDKTVNSILKTANLGLGFLSNDAISRLVRISSLDFEEMKHGPRPTVVLVTMPTKMLHQCRNWFSLLLGSALQRLNSTLPGRWPVLVTVDEAQLIPPQRELIQCYLESRKRGVQVCTYWQNTSGPDIYGKNALKHLEAGSDVVLYLGARDMNTARHVSERAGSSSVIVPHFSYAAERGAPGVLFNEQSCQVLTPQQVIGLNRNRAIAFIGGENSNAFIIGRRPWWDYPELRSRIAPDIFHRRKP